MKGLRDFGLSGWYISDAFIEMGTTGRRGVGRGSQKPVVGLRLRPKHRGPGALGEKSRKQDLKEREQFRRIELADFIRKQRGH